MFTFQYSRPTLRPRNPRMSEGSQRPVAVPGAGLPLKPGLCKYPSTRTHPHTDTDPKFLYNTHTQKEEKREWGKGREEKEGEGRAEKGEERRERERASFKLGSESLLSASSPLDHPVLALQLYSYASNLTSAILSGHQDWQLITYVTALEINLDSRPKATSLVPHIYNFTFLGGWRAEFKTDLN